MRARSLYPATFLLAVAWLSATGCARPVKPPTRPKRAVIVVLDMFRADYPGRLRLPALEALARRGTVFENAHVGHLPATTVVSHQVLPRGLFPRNLAWSDDLYRDREGLLGEPGRLYDPGEFDLTRMRTLLSKLDTAHVARIFAGRGRFLAVGQKDYAVNAMAGEAADLVVTLSGTQKSDGPHGPDAAGWVHPVGLGLPTGWPGKPRSRFWLDTRPAYGTEDAVYRLGGHRTVAGPDPDRPGGDAWVMDVAFHLLERHPDWSLAMITLGAVDRVGHMYGADRDLDHPNGSQVHMRDLLLAADAQVGRLVDFLRRRGLQDETLLVITADHAGMGATRWHGMDRPGASSGNWIWGRLENAETEAAIRAPLLPLAEAGLEAIYSDTALRLYLKPDADLSRIVELTSALPGVVLVAAKRETPGGYFYEPVFSKPEGLGARERAWFEAMTPGLLATWACGRAPEVVALLDEHTSWGQPGDHGGAQEAVQRIPMMFAGPGIPVRRVSAQARLVDLAPTLWALFGRTPPARMDGVSLVPSLR